MNLPRKASPTDTSAAAYLAAARSLEALVERDADEAERLQHLTDAVVTAFKREGLYHMLAPRPLGGGELPWIDALRVVEAVSRADGSTGWCLMVGNVICGAGGAYLSADGARRLFAKGRDLMIAGQGIPRGFAERVEGGYLVRGDWGYGSGIYHADYTHNGCVLTENGAPVRNAAGAPEIVLCHVERKDVELKGNWDVLGLRGTGSFDYSIRETFVPEALCHPYYRTTSELGGHQYCLGMVGFTTWGHTAFALGLGRRVLDEIASISLQKGNPFGLLCNSATFQDGYARAEARYRAARAYSYAVWESICETLARGAEVSNTQVAEARMAMRHIHDVVSESSVWAHKAGGGVSLRPSVLQRCFRDMHAATQHLLLSDQILQDCARTLLGMDAGKKWTLIGLQ
jgi:alkylation response protein AidB-like acyl-CoA dehydrogenase